MGKINIYLEVAKEVEQQMLVNNLEFNAALRVAKEKHFGKEKAQSPATKQGKEHVKLINDSITDLEDIDNGEVYDINTGITTRDL